jgi:hypothetical protein
MMAARLHTDDSFSKALLAQAFSLAAQRKTKNVAGPIVIKATITITPPIALLGIPGGGVSGCFDVEVCEEDDEAQMSHCYVREVCGEFPPIE